MRRVIVGATPVGVSLARQASENGDDVWLIERETTSAQSNVSMYAGRLEIMPVLIVLLDLFRRIRGRCP